MLPTPGRYEYSNITKREVYDWPNDTRLAVYVAVNIEQFSYGEGKGAAIAPPDQAQSHSIYSWRDYGNRVGIWRLFEMFDDLEIPIEAQINTELYNHCPDIPEALRERWMENQIIRRRKSDPEKAVRALWFASRDAIPRQTSLQQTHRQWQSPPVPLHLHPNETG